MVPVMVPVTTKMIVPVAIVVTVPVSTVRVVIRPVIGRRIRKRLDDRNTRKTDSDADIGMCLGGNTLSHTCDPESG